MGLVRCEQCGEDTPGYDTVSYGSMDRGYRQLCTRCFNIDVAERIGLDDFENVRLEPVGLTDSAGKPHQFHFRTRLTGQHISLEAFELYEGCPAGYQFQILGDPEEDVFQVLARMVERIRRTISKTHLVDEGHGIQIAEQTVRGRIDCDLSDGDSLPLLVIDGREVTWDEMGRMLMAFEGWNFRMELFDPSDEP